MKVNKGNSLDDIKTRKLPLDRKKRTIKMVKEKQNPKVVKMILHKSISKHINRTNPKDPKYLRNLIKWSNVLKQSVIENNNDDGVREEGKTQRLLAYNVEK